VGRKKVGRGGEAHGGQANQKPMDRERPKENAVHGKKYSQVIGSWWKTGKKFLKKRTPEPSDLNFLGANNIIPLPRVNLGGDWREKQTSPQSFSGVT